MLRMLNVLYFSRCFKWLYILLKPVHILNQYITGIQIHPKTQIGGGIKFSHFSDIVINGQAKLGSNIMVFNGVTIGSVRGNGKTSGVPTIGNYVFIGPGAKVLGNVHIGDYVFIGANSVVTKDIPDGCTVVGNPAKVINNNGKENIRQYFKDLHDENNNKITIEMIPKIIHQTAKTREISWEEKRLIKRAKRRMADYEFRLYDDNDNYHLIKQYFPQYLEKYERISKGVAKADVARLVYMYVYGGWYCDTDYLWLTPPDKYLAKLQLNGYKCILPISRDDEKPFKRLGNAVFGSEAGHPFWKSFIDYIFQSDELNSLREDRIEKVTGPEGLTDFYKKHISEFSDVYFPEKKYFHPRLKGAYAMIENGTVGIHFCWASWRSGTFKDRLKNLIRRKINAIR